MQKRSLLSRLLKYSLSKVGTLMDGCTATGSLEEFVSDAAKILQVLFLGASARQWS